MGYDRPETLTDALAILARAPRTLLAGGTDLYPATSAPELAGPVLDLAGLGELAGIARRDGHLRIGACTPWAAIRDAAPPPACDALRAAAAEVGGVQIQNAGTIGGNLCNASPAADGVPPLLVARRRGRARRPRRPPPPPPRRLPPAAPRATARRPDEILTAVLLPEASLAGRSAFLKLGARAYLVISIAMVAVRLAVADGRVTAAALAVGACGPVATRLPSLEARLTGAPADARLPGLVDTAAVAAALRPIDDVRATAAYRAEAAAELLRRALAASGLGVKLHRPGLGFTLNGRPAAFDAPPTRRLSELLREDAGLTGTKVGCDAGDCGACTVLLDGEPVCACLTPAARAAGRRVTTVEGLAADGALSRLQAAFLRHGAAQCGICTPGMLMAATALLARVERPSEAEVAAGPRRRPLPLHRLPQDHRRRHGRRPRRRPAPPPPPAPPSAPASPASTAAPRSTAATPSAPTSGSPAASSSRPSARPTRTPASPSATSTPGPPPARRSPASSPPPTSPGANRFGVIAPYADQPALAEARRPLPRRGRGARRLRGRRPRQPSTASPSPGRRSPPSPTPPRPSTPARRSSTPTAPATA